ncbi:hypothetical protein BDA96_01G188400 [Sorghum bicolor]|uniref:Uncharacterized protein n=2 Tax=Sorghum bicolor TaxID=4558 RepID=A0A921RZ20_SORBI|nr:hypothetical protein BDA96_01G188400 [Sorghum bicolor]OQU91429.1 hypothetical protein SORBI_3001G179620 [Sorghum bicolor]
MIRVPPHLGTTFHDVPVPRFGERAHVRVPWLLRPTPRRRRPNVYISHVNPRRLSDRVCREIWEKKSRVQEEELEEDNRAFLFSW